VVDGIEIALGLAPTARVLHNDRKSLSREPSGIETIDPISGSVRS
jgi:hypothetical protein